MIKGFSLGEWCEFFTLVGTMIAVTFFCRRVTCCVSAKKAARHATVRLYITLGDIYLNPDWDTGSKDHLWLTGLGSSYSSWNGEFC